MGIVKSFVEQTSTSAHEIMAVNVIGSQSPSPVLEKCSSFESRERKSFVNADTKLPKMFKSDSLGAISVGSQSQPLVDSQSSNYSISRNCDVIVERKMA